jgi:hypothetical protein
VAKPTWHTRGCSTRCTHGRHYCWKSHKLDSSRAVIDVVVDQAAQVTSPLSAVPILLPRGRCGAGG